MSQIDDAEGSGFDRKDVLDALDELVQLLGRIPGASKYLADVEKLKSILLEKRPPRIAVVGRRGAGKSSIANAILGCKTLRTNVIDEPADPEWQHLDVDGRVLNWLDTSGIGAGGIASERLDALKTQIASEAPDTIVFACKAKEVDAEIDATLEQFKAILAVLGSGANTPKVVVALTQCDELNPGRSKDVPYPEKKMEEISIVMAKLTEHLARHHVETHAIVPISTEMEFDDAGTMSWDGRFNIGELERRIFEVMPLNAQIEAARLFERFRGARRTLGVKIVRLCATVAFGIGAVPIPVGDIAPLYSLQLLMVTAVAYLSGRKPTLKSVSEWVAALGAGAGLGVALREVFRQAIKAIPGFGSAISAGLAAAGTYSLGMSATVYFLDGKTAAEAKATFDSGKSREWKNPDDLPPEA